MFYVIELKADRSVALEAEMAGTGRQDVLELPRLSTCLSKIIACLKYAAHVQVSLSSGHVSRFDSVVISDDDAVIHPQRFLLDMAEAAAPGLVYGQLAWAGGWDKTHARHFGYATQAFQAAGLLYGRCNVVSCPWKALVPSRALVSDAAPRPTAPATIPLYCNGCSPFVGVYGCLNTCMCLCMDAECMYACVHTCLAMCSDGHQFTLSSLPVNASVHRHPQTGTTTIPAHHRWACGWA